MTERVPRGEGVSRAPAQTRKPSKAPAKGGAGPAAGAEKNQLSISALQQQAGNSAVVQLLSSGRTKPKRPMDPAPLQRVAVTAPSREETLFNQQPAPGQAGAAVFGGAGGRTFDMARDGTPESVTVTVRIRFIQQNRKLSAPDAAGRTVPVDDGPKSVIPPGDARRPFAQTICDTAPAHWTGRAVLVGQRDAPGFPASMWNSDKGGPVRLPLKFKAVPVWDLEPVKADKEIRVFPQAQQAGGPVHPIDAAHYYMNKGPNYAGATDEAIYAHEYGHLLGLSDEYSQSNPQMHALMHEMDPGTASERGKAMDRESVRRMVLAALFRPLMDRVSASTVEISKAFTAGKAPVVTGLAKSLRTALNEEMVRKLLVANVPPAQAALLPSIPGLVKAAVANSVNSGAVAATVVGGEFAAGAMGALVKRLYFGALNAASTGTADIGGINMHIDIAGTAGIDGAGNVFTGPTGLWAGGGAPAADIGSAVDKAAGTARIGRVPPVRASGSVLRELASLPTGWAGIPAAAPAALASGTLQADLSSALASAWLAKLMTAAAAPTPIARRRALAQAVQTTVHSASVAAATNAVRAFLQAEIQPVMKTSTTALMAAIGDEVTRIMGTPANQLALTSTRDPAIASIATTMKTQLDNQIKAAETAQKAAAGSTAVNPGVTAPNQQVTYSTVNMMSDNTDIFRPDEFTHLATLFNKAGLKKDRETDFHVEMGAT
ncbi:MAG: hypothetical protein ABWZ02_11230 [Nakamurella sp.]